MAWLPEETVARLKNALVEAARPKRIILFGSQAHREAPDDSDVDVMMARLNRALRSLGIAVDLLVLSEAQRDRISGGRPGSPPYGSSTSGDRAKANLLPA